jgi:patatin-like phospholipase/acyl hydrolase
MFSRPNKYFFQIFLTVCLAFSTPAVSDSFKALQFKPQKKLIKILSIDGGGIRGIIPVLVLKNLESRLKKKKHLTQCFDVMSGTSTGGLIILMLNAPNATGTPKYTASHIAELYKNLGNSIFSQSFWRWLLSFNGWLFEKYSSETLEEFMHQWLGDIKLRDAITNIIIPAYDISNHKAMFFRKTKAQIDWGKDFFMRDIGRATSAAPTYFEPALIESVGGKQFYTLIDGGVAVNNPSISACVYAIELYGRDADFLVVSLGTGTDHHPDKKKFVENGGSFNGGKLWWANKIIDTLMYASSDTVHYQLLQLLNNDKKKLYYRFQPVIDAKDGELDNISPENIKALETYAQELITHHDQELTELAEILDSEVL